MQQYNLPSVGVRTLPPHPIKAQHPPSIKYKENDDDDDCIDDEDDERSSTAPTVISTPRPSPHSSNSQLRQRKSKDHERAEEQDKKKDAFNGSEKHCNNHSNSNSISSSHPPHRIYRLNDLQNHKDDEDDGGENAKENKSFGDPTLWNNPNRPFLLPSPRGLRREESDQDSNGGDMRPAPPRLWPPHRQRQYSPSHTIPLAPPPPPPSSTSVNFQRDINARVEESISYATTSDDESSSDYYSNCSGEEGDEEEEEEFGGAHDQTASAPSPLRGKTTKDNNRQFPSRTVPIASGETINTSNKRNLFRKVQNVVNNKIIPSNNNDPSKTAVDKVKNQVLMSFLQTKCDTFVVSRGDVDAKAIVDWFQLPKYEISKVDHRATVPGNAFQHGYTGRKLEIRNKAIEFIRLTFEKFHHRKSFWAIVPKIPDRAKSIVFCDEKRRIYQSTWAEGDANPSSRSSTRHFLQNHSVDDEASMDVDDYNRSMRGGRSRNPFVSTRSMGDGYASSDPSIDVESEGDKDDNTFYIKRVKPSIVFVRRWLDEEYVKFMDDFDVPDLKLPPNYDLLINPFFFAGDDYFQEVARDIVCLVTRGSTIYGSTLTPVIARGFLLLFGKSWQELIEQVTTRCKRGLDDEGMEWPRFLETIHSEYGPAPDYYDIPRGYWMHASAMLLGLYGKVGVRELWASSGLVGMYSFARRIPAIGYNQEIAMTFAMLREATWGCRSRQLGVRLLHSLPIMYHNDYLALCTIPWSDWNQLPKTKEESFVQRADLTFHLDRTERAIKLDLEMRNSISPRKFSSTSSLDSGKSREERAKVMLTASRFVVTVRNPRDRGTMNFLGGMGLEMIGVDYPTLIEDHMSVVAESFLDWEDAKSELRSFCTMKKMLPGAVIRAATANKGGILNVIQEDRHVRHGHIRWMRKYSFYDSISTITMIVGASILGTLLKTGAFHFMLAITVLTRINEEISIFGTYQVLFKGREHGHTLHEDTISKFLVPALLGSVEAAYELVEPHQFWMAEIVLIVSGCLAALIIILTLVARLKFQKTRGSTWDEVIARDGSIECLLTGETETGFRSIDHIDGPGVGPLQAQLFSVCESNGGDVASSTASAPYHVSGSWMIAGTLQKNFDLQFGMSAANHHHAIRGVSSLGGQKNRPSLEGVLMKRRNSFDSLDC